MIQENSNCYFSVEINELCPEIYLLSLNQRKKVTKKLALTDFYTALQSTFRELI